jgi:hypothetical protein
MPQDAPSPRVRGEGWGEGPLRLYKYLSLQRGRLPLTRSPRAGARIPTSPRKRGEVAGRAVDSFTGVERPRRTSGGDRRQVPASGVVENALVAGHQCGIRHPRRGDDQPVSRVTMKYVW